MSATRFALLAVIVAACHPGRTASKRTPPPDRGRVPLMVPAVPEAMLGAVRASAFVTVTEDQLAVGALDLAAGRGVGLAALVGTSTELAELPARIATVLGTSELEPARPGFGPTCYATMHPLDDHPPAVLVIAEGSVDAAALAQVLGRLPRPTALVAHGDDPALGRPLRMVVDRSGSRSEIAPTVTIGAATDAGLVTSSLRAGAEDNPALLTQVVFVLVPGATVDDLVAAITGAVAAEVDEIVLLDVVAACDGTGVGLSDVDFYGGVYSSGGDDADAEPRRPEVRIGQIQGSGDLDKAVVRRYIKRNLARITACYEKQLLVEPDLEGTLTASFLIRPSGAVSNTRVTGLDPDVDTCVQRVIQAIAFPKPKGGGSVQVTYPFTFRPGGRSQ